MQITGKVIKFDGVAPPMGMRYSGHDATIELPEVNQENIMAGDTIWVEKIVPTNEPLTQFLKRHPRVVAHFPLPQQEKKKIKEIEELPELDEDDRETEYQRIVRMYDKINELIVFTQKLAERIK